MTKLCEQCIGGPSGIEGHGALRALSLGESGMAFTCLRCGTLWTRTYSTTGQYDWLHCLEAGVGIGASLPPITAVRDSAPAAAPMNSVHGAAEHWLAIQLSWKRPRRKPG